MLTPWIQTTSTRLREGHQRTAHPLLVLGRGVDQEVDAVGGADEPRLDDGHAADHHVAGALAVEVTAEGDEVP
jgi:hypothetical protein